MLQLCRKWIFFNNLNYRQILLCNTVRENIPLLSMLHFLIEALIACAWWRATQCALGGWAQAAQARTTGLGAAGARTLSRRCLEQQSAVYILSPAHILFCAASPKSSQPRFTQSRERIVSRLACRQPRRMMHSLFHEGQPRAAPSSQVRKL